MSPEHEAHLHGTVFRRTATDPAWLGYWLAQHQQTEQLPIPQLAQKLGVSMDNLTLLSLCRSPRTDYFREDLQVVCQRTGAHEQVLAQLLRQEQALHQWKGAPIPKPEGWLMAASGRPPEQGPPPSAPHEEHDDT